MPLRSPGGPDQAAVSLGSAARPHRLAAHRRPSRRVPRRPGFLSCARPHHPSRTSSGVDRLGAETPSARRTSSSPWLSPGPASTRWSRTPGGVRATTPSGASREARTTRAVRDAERLTTFPPEKTEVSISPRMSLRPDAHTLGRRAVVGAALLIPAGAPGAGHGTEAGRRHASARLLPERHAPRCPRSSVWRAACSRRSFGSNVKLDASKLNAGPQAVEALNSGTLNTTAGSAGTPAMDRVRAVRVTRRCRSCLTAT